MKGLVDIVRVGVVMAISECMLVSGRSDDVLMVKCAGRV